MGIVEVKDLSLAFNGKTILNRLTIDFWEGHVHAIVGPNGAGKSTLASTIMGLTGYRKISGDITFEGASIAHLDIAERARKGITLGWQEPARFEGLKVREFIRASAGGRGNNAEAEKCLEQVGLSPAIYRDRSVDKTLSGGERKKVELASILAMRPRVVFLDEPDSGIDVESLERIFDAIRILREHGSTVILITHSLTVLKQADHAFLMCHGELLDKGPVEKIMGYFERKCLPCDHKNLPSLDAMGGRA